MHTYALVSAVASSVTCTYVSCMHVYACRMRWQVQYTCMSCMQCDIHACNITSMYIACGACMCLLSSMSFSACVRSSGVDVDVAAVKVTMCERRDMMRRRGRDYNTHTMHTATRVRNTMLTCFGRHTTLQLCHTTCCHVVSLLSPSHHTVTRLDSSCHSIHK